MLKTLMGCHKLDAPMTHFGYATLGIVPTSTDEVEEHA